MVIFCECKVSRVVPGLRMLFGAGTSTESDSMKAAQIQLKGLGEGPLNEVLRDVLTAFVYMEEELIGNEGDKKSKKQKEESLGYVQGMGSLAAILLVCSSTPSFSWVPYPCTIRLYLSGRKMVEKPESLSYDWGRCTWRLVWRWLLYQGSCRGSRAIVHM